ncbi:MAG TPA: hypothetical protein VF476_01825 [Chitinophagaceae bacterium]
MKKKIVYLFAFAICISLLSSAKQAGKNCDKKMVLVKKEACKQNKKTEKRSNPDLSPLNFFLNI